MGIKTKKIPRKILIFGISGMLGSTFFKYLSENENYYLYGTVRDNQKKNLVRRICPNGEILVFNKLLDESLLENFFNEIKPDFVINCIGIIKQSNNSIYTSSYIAINSLFPHLLSNINEKFNSKLIQISTDCVFSGNKGMYSEQDIPDASDIYGRSKLLGELVDNKKNLTIRTSIIGHEIQSFNSLLNWFLSQTNNIKGFSRAIFSGFTTLELAKIFENYILPNDRLTGLYHISSNPITKYNLLLKIKDIYGKEISITKDEVFEIDRSLNSKIFREMTGFSPKSWDSMIFEMKEYNNYIRLNKDV